VYTDKSYPEIGAIILRAASEPGGRHQRWLSGLPTLRPGSTAVSLGSFPSDYLHLLGSTDMVGPPRMTGMGG
jgi:hypothetical protein